MANYEYKDGRPFDWDEFAPGFNEDNAVKEEVFVSKLTSDNKQVEEYTPYKEKLLVMYDERDPRMQVSIILPYTMYKGWASNAPKDCEYVLVKSGSTLAVNGMIQADGNLNNYLWRKFVPEYDMDGMINNREDTPINFPIIRYADVLLMLAECYNEMDGRRDEAVALINEVRARVGMPGINSGPTWLAANSKEEVFERIKHERAVEFACEGLRFSDLRRWGIYEQTMNGKTKVNIYGDSFYSHSVTTRDNLWPIPGSERDKNPLLEQNPGWD